MSGGSESKVQAIPLLRVGTDMKDSDAARLMGEGVDLISFVSPGPGRKDGDDVRAQGCDVGRMLAVDRLRQQHRHS
jgi:hypothetical protein